MKTIEYAGKNYDFDVVASHMNDEIREDLHAELASCSDQEFFDTYMERNPDFMNEYEMDLYPVLEL